MQGIRAEPAPVSFKVEYVAYFMASLTGVCPALIHQFDSHVRSLHFHSPFYGMGVALLEHRNLRSLSKYRCRDILLASFGHGYKNGRPTPQSAGASAGGRFLARSGIRKARKAVSAANAPITYMAVVSP